MCQVEAASRNDSCFTGRANLRAQEFTLIHLNGASVGEVAGQHAAFYGHCTHCAFVFAGHGLLQLVTGHYSESEPRTPGTAGA